MEISSSAFKAFTGIKSCPTIENYSDSISDYFRKRNRSTVFLLSIFVAWSSFLLFFPDTFLYLMTITNALFLLVMLIKRNSFDRKEQKRKKTIFNLAVLKCLFELLVLIIMTYSCIQKGTLLNTSLGVLMVITGVFEGLYLILGIYILQQTKEIIQVLDLEFYDKEWSSYFQITST